MDRAKGEIGTESRGESWIAYRIVAPRPRKVVTGTLKTVDPGVKVVIQRAFARLGLDVGPGARRFVTDMVVDVEPAGPPGIAAYTVSVSYWPQKVEEQP